MPITQYALPLAIVRVACAGNMLIHGVYRLSVGGVTPFDAWLSSFGFPPFTAWIITIFEIIAAILIILDRWTSILCIAFMIQLIAGIVMIHAHEGWFVVGGGRNGVEYSMLMIVCLGAVGIAYWKKSK